MKRKSWYGAALCAALGITFSLPAAAFDGEVKAGSGTYSTVLPQGAAEVQSLTSTTPNVSGVLPSSKWWSSLAWDPYSEAQYPHPLAVKNEEQGFRIYHPGPRMSADDSSLSGSMSEAGDFVAGHSEVSAFPDARVDGYSDWFVNAKYTYGTKTMKVAYGHGSPYVFFTYSGGNPSLTFTGKPEIWHGGRNSPVLGLTINGAHYGLYGPSGSTWSGIGTNKLINSLNGKHYFSIAALPDNRPETLEKFREYAYSHVTDTKVSWTYDSGTSDVVTTYEYKTEAKEGTQKGTIFALYPHQWKHSGDAGLPYAYSSVRGTMKTGEGSSFRTKMKYTGMLPALPDSGSYDRAKLAKYIEEAGGEDYIGAPDTYSVGKRLGKLAALVPIAEQAGDGEAAAQFRGEIKSRLEDWLTSSDADGTLNHSELFYYNKSWGTLIGYPASYGTDTELNDHHIHYGYFIRAAAELARNDKTWADGKHYGPMIDLLIRDIANPEREDSMFPFLRHFDPFAGHSWSSGHGRFGDGNFNGSSSEVMNAWSALIMWGEAVSDPKIRDLGIYLYTTEMNAIKEYWFDAEGTNLGTHFDPVSASIVWGGKTAGNSTWWTTRPTEAAAVNWLPVTGASLYLTHQPSYADRQYSMLVRENGSDSFEAWEDLIYMYRAASNPDEAKTLFDRQADAMVPEPGNSKANAYHWITTIASLGVQNSAITADTPFFAVFEKEGRRTYVVYNMTESAQTVHFSDGTSFRTEPGQFTVEKHSG